MNSTKSDFNVEVVRITEVKPHPNADRLDIAIVYGTTPVIIRKGEYVAGDLAVYIPVDAIVDVTRPAFSFLKSPRIKAARLRGVYSEGLLVHPTAVLGTNNIYSLEEGQNVQTALGITKHLSEADRSELFQVNPGVQKRSPNNPEHMPIYGLDSLKRFAGRIPEGTLVVCTEKIHGCNARFQYRGGRLWVGSHRTMRDVSRHVFFDWCNTVWLNVLELFGSRRGVVEKEHGDVWVKVANKLDLKTRLAAYPNHTFYGEVYGQGLQKRGGVSFVYDCHDQHGFRVFDIYDSNTKQYLSYVEMRNVCQRLGLDTAPLVYLGSWAGMEKMEPFTRGPSLLNFNHIREGLVVRTDVYQREANRQILKFVSDAYKLLGGES